MSEEEKNKIKENARNWYCNLTEEQKNKKRVCGRNRYHTMIKVC